MNLVASLFDAILTVAKIACIIVPLTVAYQVARDNRWVRRALTPYRGSLSKLGFGEAALVPLAAGIVLGIMYGAGILVQESRAGRMSPREVFLLAFFLGTCHAVIEDTLLFVVIGGNGWWILVPRVSLAVVATAALARLGSPKQNPTP